MAAPQWVEVRVKPDEAAHLASDRCEARGHLTALHNGHCCVFCMVPGCTCEWGEVKARPAIPDKNG